MMRDPGTGEGRNGQAGFTLIEFLITMAILGLIASFVIPSFISTIERANATTCIIYRQNIQTAADYYIKTNNLQPGDTMPTLNQLVSENILPNVDSCPSGGIYVWSHPDYEGLTTPFLLSCSVHFLVGM